jgi:hypothetical protein
MKNTYQLTYSCPTVQFIVYEKHVLLEILQFENKSNKIAVAFVLKKT